MFTLMLILRQHAVIDRVNDNAQIIRIIDLIRLRSIAAGNDKGRGGFSSNSAGNRRVAKW
jgi:hypothetical protein